MALYVCLGGGGGIREHRGKKTILGRQVRCRVTRRRWRGFSVIGWTEAVVGVGKDCAARAEGEGAGEGGLFGVVSSHGRILLYIEV